MPKKKKPKGLSKSQKEWEEFVLNRAARFIDRLTVTDILNVIVFGAAAYASYKGIKGVAGIEGYFPDWLKWISPLSPFLYQLLIPSHMAKSLPEHEKIILAIIAGYSAVKLAPVVVHATETALIA